MTSELAKTVPRAVQDAAFRPRRPQEPPRTPKAHQSARETPQEAPKSITSPRSRPQPTRASTLRARGIDFRFSFLSSWDDCLVGIWKELSWGSAKISPKRPMQSLGCIRMSGIRRLFGSRLFPKFLLKWGRFGIQSRFFIAHYGQCAFRFELCSSRFLGPKWSQVGTKIGSKIDVNFGR